MKVLVVGEAPSRWMHENRVTEPLPLARHELARLAGLIPYKFDELFECANVLDQWPGKQGKGDAFPLEVARPRAQALAQKAKTHDRVVLLGRRVEAAFCLRETPWFEWHRAPYGTETLLAVAPHPSHVSRWWNDAKNRRAAAIFWGSIVQVQA